MRIPLERNSKKAVYLQIRDRILRLIETGALQVGEKLPSIRALAENTGVNKLTVIEAYNVLEADGLIAARQGSGYYVNSACCYAPTSNFAPPQDVILSEQQGSSFYNLYMSAIAARHSDMIDLSCGFPVDSGLEDLQRIARRAMNQIDSLFNYDYPQGQLILRQQIARMLVQRGLEITPENLIITSGSQQGLSLSLAYYVQKGDWVIVESPTHQGVLALLANLGAKVIGIPMTAEGMNLELLEKYLYTHRPSLIYTISTLHNPTGITTSQAHRTSLLRLTKQYNCVILEDNAYEGLNFEPVPPPIKALDCDDVVTYIGTFSKTLIPGIRVGYMVVTGKHLQPLIERKLLTDFHVSTVSQAVVSEYLASGHYRHRLAYLRTHYQQTRNVMLNALKHYFPSNASWTVPNGGIFLWVQLPDSLPVHEIYSKALTQKVLIAEGAPFFPGKQGYPAMRLTFSHTPEKIEHAIAVLGKFIKSIAN